VISLARLRTPIQSRIGEVEKEEIDAYYGCFVPLRRTSDIREMRPEDALDGSGLPMATATTDELLLHSESQWRRIRKPEARIWFCLAGHALVVGICKSAIATAGETAVALQILHSHSGF